MFTPLKPPRGSAAQVAMHTGVEGSIVVNTDAKTIHVHDGVTPGGFALSKVGHQHTKNEMISFLGYLPVDPSTIGQANGVAPLDATGKVPASMIPNGAGGGGVSDAGDLTGTTLSPSVVNSSLTSVGVLQNLTVAGVISGSVSGSASKLSNARSIVISGDVDGSASFDGSADINISVALDNVNSSPVENALKKITVNAKGQVISTDDVSLQDLSDALGFTPVSQSYVDGVASNFVQRPGVRFASDANLAGTYSNGTNGEDATLSGSGSIPAIGGGTPVLNDRIALMYQGNGVQNGIYKVTQTNPWVLTRDGGLDDVKNGAMVLVAEGTHAGEKWIQIAPNPITLGTSPLQYTMFQAAATAYQSGAGISVQNNTITNTGVRSLAGTPNQISFSASTGAITASLTPSVTISGTMTAGSFAGSGASLTGLNAANLSAGIVPTARLGSGTADGTTFLAGDGTWKNISIDASNLAGFGEVAYNANKRGVYAGVRTIVNQGANPVVVLNQTGASSGNRTSIISVLADGSIRWTLNSDDMSSLGAFMSVYRNVGTATSIVFTSTAFQIQANASIAGTLNVSSVITGNGSGLTALNANSLSSGTVPAARLGSGTANASTFLAGDGTWRSATASTINATGQVTLDSSRAGFTAGLNPSSNPLVYMVNAAALTNSKVMYQSYTSAGVFNMGWMTDAGSQATPFLAATRNGGDVTTANLVLTANIVNVQGTLSATSFSGNGSALTNLDASKLIGVARPANLGAGTANALTFLRGDGSWAVVNPTTLAGTGDIPTSSTVSGVYAGRLSGNSLMQFVNLNAPSGKRVWDMRVDTNGDFAVGTMTDAVTDLTYALRIQRTAAGASNITLDATNITLSGVIQGNGAYSTTGAISAASFTGNGSGLTNLNASNITTGVVAAGRLGSGTASASTFLRGDGTWASISSSAVIGTSDMGVSTATTAARVGAAAGSPYVTLTQASAGTDDKYSWVRVDTNGTLNYSLVNDANSSAVSWMTVARSGTTATNITLRATAITLNAAVSATSISGSGSGLTALNASSLATGTVPAARLASGTADNTTFLRGDGTWAIPVVVPTSVNATGSASPTVSTTGVYVGGGSTPTITYTNAAASAGNKAWETRVDSSGNFQINLNNDALNSNPTVLQISRTGQTASNFAVTATAITLTGAVTATSFSGNGTSLTNLNASNLASGTVNVARLGSGTANNSTFLRGDGTWATVTSTWNGGTVSAATSFTSTLAVKSVSGDVVAVAASNIDCSAGNYFTKTASGALTWTVSNVPASRFYSFILKLTNGGTGAQTWFSNTKWEGGTAPTLSASGVDILGFFTDDGGATWHGIALSIGSR